MLVSIEMQTSCVCPSCNIRNPIPGLRTSIVCYACVKPIDVQAIHADARDGGLQYHFGGYYDALAEVVVLPSTGDGACEGADRAVSLKRAVPACTACRAPLDANAIGAAIGGHVICGMCSEQVAVRAPDDETRAWDPRITCVVGDAKGRGLDADRARGTEGTTVGCSRCGAPLSTEGKHRTASCAHCGARSFLGDAVWTKLHPTPDAHSFHLVYDVTLEQQIALHQTLIAGDRDRRHSGIASHYFLKGPEEARIVDALARLEDHVARTIDGSLTPEARRSMAAGPTSTPLAQLFAASPDPLVRVALAGRADLPAGLISTLVRDAQPVVRATIAARPSLEPDHVTSLATDPDVSVRTAIASRQDTPADLLTRLRKDAAPEVAAAVKRNPSYKPGFFEKLLG